MWISKSLKKKDDTILVLRTEKAALESERAALVNDIRTLKEELAREKSRGTFPYVDTNLGDPSPNDQVNRTMYVAQVAGLHKDVLEPKLKQMISTLHAMLSEASNDREYDQALKGAIYFAWELIRWGDRMVNEQVHIQSQGEVKD